MSVVPDDADLIDVLQAKLRRYPHVRYEGSAYHLSILPLDEHGFRIDVIVRQHSYSVSCDGWYTQFREASDALDCVELALSESTRLEVWVRGKTRYRWILQRRSKQGWATVGERTALLRPFWRRRRIVYLQNRLLEAA